MVSWQGRSERGVSVRHASERGHSRMMRGAARSSEAGFRAGRKPAQAPPGRLECLGTCGAGRLHSARAHPPPWPRTGCAHQPPPFAAREVDPPRCPGDGCGDRGRCRHLGRDRRQELIAWLHLRDDPRGGRSGADLPVRRDGAVHVRHRLETRRLCAPLGADDRGRVPQGGTAGRRLTGAEARSPRSSGEANPTTTALTNRDGAVSPEKRG